MGKQRNVASCGLKLAWMPVSDAAVVSLWFRDISPFLGRILEANQKSKKSQEQNRKTVELTPRLYNHIGVFLGGFLALEACQRNGIENVLVSRDHYGTKEPRHTLCLRVQARTYLIYLIFCVTIRI